MSNIEETKTEDVTEVVDNQPDTKEEVSTNDTKATNEISNVGTKDTQGLDLTKIQEDLKQLTDLVKELQNDKKEVEPEVVKEEPKQEVKVEEKAEINLDDFKKEYENKIKALEEDLSKLRKANEFTSSNTSHQQNERGIVGEMSAEDVLKYRQRI